MWCDCGADTPFGVCIGCGRWNDAVVLCREPFRPNVALIRECLAEMGIRYEGQVMTKQLQITMPDGSVWHVPAQFVAEVRAEYYAQKDHERDGADFDTVYADEVRHALEDGYEIVDWATNNMGWTEDLAPRATCVRPAPPPDYAALWGEAECKVVER